MEDIFKTIFDLIRAEGDPSSVQKAFARLDAEIEKDPNNPKPWFEYAGAHDYLGHESEAASLYQKVLALGVDLLPEKDRPCFYVQYGSTLRNLGQYDEAHALLETGIHTYPDFYALKLFKALNDYSRGINRPECLALLNSAIETPADDSVRRYLRALTSYTKALGSPLTKTSR